MPQNTPRGYTYPLYSDPATFPAQLQDLALDVDADVDALYDAVNAALNAPSAYITGVNQALPVNANTTLSFSAEIYDNDNMVNLGVSPTFITVQTPGIYLMTAHIRVPMAPGVAGALLLRFGSSGILVPEPALVSRQVPTDVNEEALISLTTLHYVPPGSTPENLTVVVRNNALVNLTSLVHEFSATKISA